MEKFACSVCGYAYDPEEDDELQLNSPFEDLSDDWLCPGCGAGKDEFEEVDE